MPLATVVPEHGATRIAAANPAARRAGVSEGLPLADARARCPRLVVRDADPAGDRRRLERLARWCVRYTPWTAVDDGEEEAGGLAVAAGRAGLWLDITGCAHLFGGEAALLDDLLARLRRCGLRACAAVADTPGAAWAMARCTPEAVKWAATEDGDPPAPVFVQPGKAETETAGLPVAGLRLPAAMLADLHRLGLRRVADLSALPRTELTARFGTLPARRLDQIAGRIGEPVSPLLPVPALRTRLAFAEPIARREDIDAALERLLVDLRDRLVRTGEGVRRLELLLCRAGGDAETVAVGTSKPVRAPDHLARLFREKLDDVDPGFGIDLMILAALAVDPLAPVQTEAPAVRSPSTNGAMTAADIGPLVDRLANRLGPHRVVRLETRASHVPERACRAVPLLDRNTTGGKANGADEAQHHRPRTRRPIHLLPSPEPVNVMAPVPDYPPVAFRWRRRQHRVVRAEGPERIGPEWWLEAAMTGDPRYRETRDYYCLEDSDGGRFWVFREGLYDAASAPRWFLHGFFA